MVLTRNSKFWLKNVIEGDRYVDGYVLTNHAEDRKNERLFDDEHILQCLKQGVTSEGTIDRKYNNRPFKNSVKVIKYGMLIAATTVYTLFRVLDRKKFSS